MTKGNVKRSRFFGKNQSPNIPVNITAHRKIHRGQVQGSTGSTTVINNTSSSSDDDSAYQSGIMIRYTAQGLGAAGYVSTPQTITTGLINDEAQIGTITGAMLTLETAPTSTASFDLLLNGTSILTLNVLAGNTESDIQPLNTDLSPGDYLQVEHTTPQDAVGNLVVWVFVSLDNV